MGRAWLVAFCAAGGGQAASSALGRPTRDALLVGDAASRVSHRLRIHRHVNVTIRPVAHAAALETANQEAAASPHISQDDTLAQRNGSCRFEAGVDYDRGGGGRAHATGVASKEACCVLCKARPSCGVATYLAASQQCWFKPFGATRRPSQSSAGVVSCILLAATLPLGQTPQHDSLHRGHGSSMQHHWARIPGQLPVVPRGQGYSSSAFEQAWTQDLVAKRAGGPGLCKLAWSQRADAAEWMAWVANSTHPSGRRAQQPPHSVARHLSRFRGGHSTGFIEPLTGMARHPLAFESVCRKSLRISPAERDELRSLLSFDARARKNRRHLLFDTDYILLDNQCDKPRTRGQTRNKFFDLGCTSYGSWDDDPSKPLEAGGSAPSIPLFFSWYREHCVEFDDIYAWEGKRMDPTSWWRGVPPFLRPRCATAALSPAPSPPIVPCFETQDPILQPFC